MRNVVITSQYLTDKTLLLKNQTNSETGSSSSGAEIETMTSLNNCVSRKEKKFLDEVIIKIFTVFKLKDT